MFWTETLCSFFNIYCNVFEFMNFLEPRGKIYYFNNVRYKSLLQGDESV